MPMETLSRGITTTNKMVVVPGVTSLNITKVKPNVTLYGSQQKSNTNSSVFKNYTCNNISSSIKPSTNTSSSLSSFSSPSPRVTTAVAGSGRLLSRTTSHNTEHRSNTGHVLQQAKAMSTNTSTNNWKSSCLPKNTNQSPSLSSLRSGRIQTPLSNNQKSPIVNSTTTTSSKQSSSTTPILSSLRLRNTKNPVNNHSVKTSAIGTNSVTNSSVITNVKSTNNTTTTSSSALLLTRKTSSPANLMRKEQNNNNITTINNNNHNNNNNNSTPTTITRKTTNASSALTTKANSSQCIEKIGLGTKQLINIKGNGSSDSSRSKKGVSTAKSVDSLATNLVTSDGNNAGNIKGFHEEKTSGSDYVIDSEKDLLIANRDYEIEQLKEKLCTQDADNRKLLLEIVSLQAQKEEKERLESSVSNMRYKYEDTIDQLKKQIENINQEKMEVLRQRISLESTVKSLETKFKTTDAERQDYKMQYLKAQQDHAAVFNNFAQLEEGSTNLNSQLLEQQQKIQTLKSQVLEKESDITTLKNQILETETLTNLLSKKETDIKTLTNQLSKRETEVKILTNQLSTKETEIKTLTNQLSTKETDIKTLTNQLSKKETDIKTLTNQLSKKETEIKTLTNQLSTKETEIKTLTNQLLEKVAEIETLKTQGKELEQNLIKEKDLRILENQLLEKEQKIQAMKVQINELEQKLREEVKQIEQERYEWKQFEDDMLVVVKVAEEFRCEAEFRADNLGKDISVLKERLEDLLECNIETKSVGVQITSCTSKTPLVRTQSQSSISSCTESSTNNNNNNNNNSDSSAKLGESNGYDADFSDKENKSNHSQESLSSSNENNNNYTKELEKSSSQIIKPLTHLDSKRNTIGSELDPLADLAQKYGGSKRKALLMWSQDRTLGYRGVDIANFSTSWNDGIALCALLHSYVPNLVPFDSLKPENRENNINVAFKAAKSLGVNTELDISELLTEMPPWQSIMCFVSDIYNRLVFLRLWYD